MTSDNGEQPSKASLGPRTLGLPQVVAQALASNAPVFGAITFVPLIAGGVGGNGAGSAIPLSVLLSTVAAFGVAWTLSRFSREMDLAGSSYVYISRSFGDRTGTAFGSLNYLAVVLAPLTPLIFGAYLEQYLASRFGVQVQWWLLSLVFVAVVGTVVAFGANFSTRAQLVWTLGAMLIIAAFSIVVIVRGLDAGVSAQAPFKPSSSSGGWLGIVWGMLYGGFIFSGFDSAQNLAEETHNPRRSIPRAMLLTVGGLAVYFLLVSYATVVGFRLDSGAIAQDSAPLLSLAAAGSYGASWLVDLLTIMLLVDILSLAAAGCVYGSRGLFALARDGRLPAALTKVSRKRSIPVVGTTLQVVWMAVLVMGTHFIGSLVSDPNDGTPEYASTFTWIAAFASLVIAIVFGVVCLAAFGWLRRRDSRPVLLVIAASVGLLSVSGLVFASLYKAPPSAYIAPAIIIAILAVSFIQSSIRRRRGTYAPSTARLLEYEAAVDK